MSASMRRCPVCSGAVPEPFLVRKDVPVHQNLLFDTPEAARAIRRGRIELVACPACGFIFNRAFEADALAYGDRYENAQDCSPAFAAHTADRAARVLEDTRDARIVEVGCGKGTFLRRLVEDAASGNSGVGFDPAYDGPESDLDGRLRFERAFFTPGSQEPVDAVVCRHVIEHIAAPAAFLQSVSEAIASANQARAYFETPCVDWIMHNSVVWDIFYEHCSYFNPRSLRYAFERAGFSIVDLRHVFSGQYLWIEAQPARASGSAQPLAGDIVSLANAFSGAQRDTIELWKRKLRETARSGKISVWGAGAKGVTFVNLFDPMGAIIDSVIDLNPRKQGRYAPGTGHPIVDYRTAAARGVRTAVLMNPNYRSENIDMLAAAGVNMELVA